MKEAASVEYTACDCENIPVLRSYQREGLLRQKSNLSPFSRQAYSNSLATIPLSHPDCLLFTPPNSLQRLLTLRTQVKRLLCISRDIVFLVPQPPSATLYYTSRNLLALPFREPDIVAFSCALWLP
jgi:hypothetical protein